MRAQVRPLQRAADVSENKPWRTDAASHPLMGQRARRFYEPPAAAIIGDVGAPLRPCDGRISGYLPPEGADAPLWRFDGDDALEEELDEHEALEAVAALAEGLTSPSEAALARAAAAAAEEASGPAVTMASSAATQWLRCSVIAVL